MDIPGLLCVPVESSVDDCEEIKFTSFSLYTFTVPGAHRYGKCRAVSDFEKLLIVGDGNFSTVYKARDKQSGEIVALKKLKTSKEPEVMSQNFLREISNLKLLNHENIVNLITVAVEKNIESTYLVLEYCEYSLSKAIDRVDQRLLRHPQIKNILCQLFCGLDYIHKHGMIHRDLSPMNIMFTEAGVLKIIDFGLSRKNVSGTLTPNQGLRWYKAPEVLFGSKEYNSSIDIWAAGCIFAEMLRLRILFPGSCDLEVIKLIVDFLGTPTESLWPGYSNLPVPKRLSLRLQPYNRIRSTFQSENCPTISFLQKVLQYNPANRPTAEQCLEHVYFRERPIVCSTDELLRTLHASVR